METMNAEIDIEKLVPAWQALHTVTDERDFPIEISLLPLQSQYFSDLTHDQPFCRHGRTSLLNKKARP